jgi:cytochrome bd ubiquinol oxidase subunit I
MDALAIDLARFQFAFTISAHIIFPAFSIGLASYLAVLEALWLRTGDDLYLRVFHYWLRIFAIVFGMGVVSGIVMSYQFGTNWSVFSDKTGPVLGPLMGYEVLSAFFLEAGFLGVMLFGLRRVGPRLHALATLMVALGTLMSAFWIVSVNSWMQTPAGYAINDKGQFVPEDWWAIVFNPSFPYRLVHMVLAAYLTTAFVVGAVGAYHLLRDNRDDAAKLMFSMAMWMAVAVTPIQIFAGDLHGLNTLQHQPMKIAAMEGHYKTRAGAPLILFGLPNNEAQETRFAIEVPKLGSFILTHDWNGTVKGLETWPKKDWPNAALLFWSFRIMIAIGFGMLAVGLWSLYARWSGGLAHAPWLQRAALLMGPSGFAAVLAGWITTEVGRQPYTVYGLLRTADSIAPVAASAVATSLVLFVLVYFAVFGAGTFYILRLMATPPTGNGADMDPTQPMHAAGLMSAPVRTSGLPTTDHRGARP